MNIEIGKYIARNGDTLEVLYKRDPIKYRGEYIWVGRDILGSDRTWTDEGYFTDRKEMHALDLVERAEASKKKPHHDLILEWLNSEVIIQYKSSNTWKDCANNRPSWIPDFEYRVKPVIKDTTYIVYSKDHEYISVTDTKPTSLHRGQYVVIIINVDGQIIAERI